MVGTVEGSAVCMPATNSAEMRLMEGLSRARGGRPGGAITGQRLWWHSSARSFAGRSRTGHTVAGASWPCLQQVYPSGLAAPRWLMVPEECLSKLKGRAEDLSLLYFVI